MTTGLSLVLSTAFSSGALLEGSKVLTSFAGDATYDVQTAFEQFDQKLAKMKSLDSLCITTDAVRYAIEKNNDELQRVSLYRLSSPEGLDSPTLIDDSISKKILTVHVLNGAHGFDGRLLSSMNEAEIEQIFERDGLDKKRPYVVSSPFSILYDDQESAAERKLRSLGAKRVWATREISNMPSVLDRETTAILSGATSHIIEDMETKVKEALSRYGIRAPPIYFGRNDGSIIGSELAKYRPLETAWGIQGHSIAAIAKSQHVPKCIVFGKLDDDHVWLGASQGHRPLMRKIGYLRNMLVHIQIPALAEFHVSLPNETKKERFNTISEIAETKNTWLGTPVDGIDTSRYPFAIKKTKMPGISMLTNFVNASISWDSALCVKGKLDLKKAEKIVRSRVYELMIVSGAKKSSIKLSKVETKPGYNLPEGTSIVSVHATGKP
jgi:hypothetical protein